MSGVEVRPLSRLPADEPEDAPGQLPAGVNGDVAARDPSVTDDPGDAPARAMSRRSRYGFARSSTRSGRDFSTRLAQVRERAGEGAASAHDDADHVGETAKQRIASVRRDEGGKAGKTDKGGKGAAAGPADETAPTGI